MKNDQLSQIWKSQSNDLSLNTSQNIIKKAKKQRSGQFITITVLSITLIILIIYAIKFAMGNWNNFALGLMLMISSLAFRLLLEFITIYRKESQLIVLDNQSFQKYLKKYYKIRLKVNYIITPICFGIYILGFTKLLPYFKQEFAEGFYIYIVISGIASMVILACIIINSTLKEYQFLQQLNRK